MKKNLLVSALIIGSLASCQVLRPPVKVFSDALDYTSYQEKGFFITEASAVSFEYQPVASVTSIVTSGYVPAVSTRQKNEGFKVVKNADDVYGGGNSSGVTWGKMDYVPASRAVALAELYKKAVDSGADGIINLKFEFFRYPINKAYEQGYQATGMAIKRK